MPMIKVGTSSYGDTVSPVYMMQGNATRDAEYKPVNGKDHAVVGIAASEDSNGKTVFVSLNGWRGHYRDVMAIQKGDSILAFGRLKVREWEGRKYYDLDADFVVKSGVMSLDAPPVDLPDDLPEFTPAAEGVTVSGPGFADLEDDGELPFD